jgi:hypothetical protein
MCGHLERPLMISSARPSAKYSCLGSSLMLTKGNTAIDVSIGFFDLRSFVIRKYPESTNTNAITNPKMILVLLFFLGIDNGLNGKRNSAEEIEAALTGLYDIKIWSIINDGIPTESDLVGYDAYIVVRGKNIPEQLNDQWVKRIYDYDRRRNSLPTERHVYDALRLKGEMFVIYFSLDKKI